MAAVITALALLALAVFLRRAKEKKQANTDIYERQIWEGRRLSNQKQVL